MDPLLRRRALWSAATLLIVGGVVSLAEIPLGDAAAAGSPPPSAVAAAPSFAIPSAPPPSFSDPFASHAPATPSSAPTATPRPVPVFASLTDSARAGYAVEGLPYTSVSGQWTQPSVACSPQQHRSVAIWVGLSSRAGRTLEEVGTEVDCLGTSGVATYAWYQVYPAAPLRLALFVGAGDVMVGRVVRSGTSVTLSLGNETLGTGVEATVTAAAPTDTAAWIVEARSPGCSTGCPAPPLASFGTVRFTSLVAGGSGQSGGLAVPGWTTERLTMVASDGIVKASTSGILPGGGFDVSWAHT